MWNIESDSLQKCSVLLELSIFQLSRLYTEGVAQRFLYKMSSAEDLYRIFIKKRIEQIGRG